MHRLCRHLLSAVFLTAAVAAAATDLTPKPFEKGDVVVTIGDSITHGRRYHSWIYLFYATRFPDQEFKIYNAGISGDSAGGAVRRFAWDIAPHKPTVATIMLGMNDVGRGLYPKDKASQDTNSEEIKKRQQGCIDGHVKNMTKLAELLQGINCRMIFITPSIFDQTADIPKANNFGVNDALGICGERARELAAKVGGGVVDYHGPMTALNAKGQEKDKSFTIVGPDRVHPGKPGQFIMSYLFLKDQQLPRYVAKMVVDAASGNAVEQGNCAISAAKTVDGGITFDCLENALPFPVPADAQSALDLIPFTEDLNQELLVVRGLAAGDYEVRIDGAVVAIVDAKQLATGLNLAMNTRTPMYRQAAQVAEVNEKRHSIYGSKLRTIAAIRHFVLEREALDPADTEKVSALLLERLEKRKKKGGNYGYFKYQTETYIKNAPKRDELFAEMEAAMAEIWKVNKPVAHHFEIVPLSDPSLRGRLNGVNIDDFSSFSGWKVAHFAKTEGNAVAKDGILTVTCARQNGRLDLYGLSHTPRANIAGKSTLKIRIKADKGEHFGLEIRVDKDFKRVCSYRPATGEWETLEFPVSGKMLGLVTLILGEPSKDTKNECDSARYQIDEIWVE